MKRYCLEVLLYNDPEKKMQEWQKTNICSDKLEMMKAIFLAPGHRIYDRIDNVQVAINADLSQPYQRE